jgi:nicotinamide-nucleotide amidase
MSEFFGHANPYLGIYSKADGIHLRVIARAADEATARAMIVPVEAAIHDRLAEYVWGYDDETPEQAVAQSLQQRGLSVAVMEYATGGFLTNSITDVPDSGRFFKGGVVASGTDSMVANGVPADVLDEYGVVSQQAANAMAHAAREKLGADFGIGISGVPGPSELEGKPMGLAYISIANERVLKEIELRVPPRRITIKRRISNQALIELRKLLEAGGQL